MRSLLLLFLVLLPGCAHLLPNASTPSPEGGALEVPHSQVREALRDLMAASPRYRDGVLALQQADAPIMIGTPKQIARAQLAWRAAPPMSDTSLGDTGALTGPEPLAIGAFVRIDMTRIHLEAHNPQRVLRDVLIHEVWGHLIPLVTTGTACEDPAEGSNPEDACVIQRENDMRAELKIGTKSVYGVSLY